MTPEPITEGTEFRHKFSYTQDQVNRFAEVTGDTNPLHIDPVYAAKSIFEKPIIHGFLGGSVFTKIFGTLFCADGNIYMKQEMKFYKPMYVDTAYEAVVKVKSLDREKNRATLETNIYEVSSGELTTAGEAVLMNKNYFK